MDDPRNLDDEYNSDFDKLTDDEFVESELLNSLGGYDDKY